MEPSADLVGKGGGSAVIQDQEYDIFLLPSVS